MLTYPHDFYRDIYIPIDGTPIREIQEFGSYFFLTDKNSTQMNIQAFVRGVRSFEPRGRTIQVVISSGVIVAYYPIWLAPPVHIRQCIKATRIGTMHPSTGSCRTPLEWSTC
jgi:hypothetical protein